MFSLIFDNEQDANRFERIINSPQVPSLSALRGKGPFEDIPALVIDNIDETPDDNGVVLLEDIEGRDARIILWSSLKIMCRVLDDERCFNLRHNAGMFWVNSFIKNGTISIQVPVTYLRILIAS